MTQIATEGHRSKADARQRGSALVEFTIVGPLITLIGLAVLQYALLFFAKNQYNYGAFMAARAGSMQNASMGAIESAYVKALVPLYGGGQSTADLARSYAKAQADVAGHLQIQILNPTRQAFDDWNDTTLQNSEGQGSKVIPNVGQAFKNPTQIGVSSGESIQDANLIKLRITQGVKPVVPFVGYIYTKFLQWADPHTDPFHTAMLAAGRLPMVMNVTVQMQSDAIESGSFASIPGQGNNGNPVDPGNPPLPTDPPPQCATVGCTVSTTPPAPVCNPATDPNGCRPPGCVQGTAACDPQCGKSYCCLH